LEMMKITTLLNRWTGTMDMVQVAISDYHV
jgi:hypothetical protein